MDIGLNIVEGLRISMGDSLENIVNDMNKSGVKYTIPFSSTVNGKSEIIILIESYGVELKMQNDAVSFIKTSNSQLNLMATIKSTQPNEVLREVLDATAQRFDIPASKLRVDRFEAKTNNCVISIPYKRHEKIKMVFIMGGHNQLFVETIQLIPNTIHKVKNRQ